MATSLLLTGIHVEEQASRTGCPARLPSVSRRWEKLVEHRRSPAPTSVHFPHCPVMPVIASLQTKHPQATLVNLAAFGLPLSGANHADAHRSLASCWGRCLAPSRPELARAVTHRGYQNKKSSDPVQTMGAKHFKISASLTPLPCEVPSSKTMARYADLIAPLSYPVGFSELKRMVKDDCTQSESF